MVSSSIIHTRTVNVVLAFAFGAAAVVMTFGALASTEDGIILLITSGAILSLTFCLAFALALTVSRTD